MATAPFQNIRLAPGQKLDQGKQQEVFDAIERNFEHSYQEFITSATLNERLENPPWVNVKSVGAKGDGKTDDTAAIQAAIKRLSANGGTVLFPPGDYVFSSLNLEGRRSVRMIGMGGLSAGAQPASRLKCTGTTNPGINLRSTYGITFEDLGIVYSASAGMTSLIDLSHGGAATDSAYACFNRCFIGGLGVSGVAQLVNLDKAISISFENVAFENAATLVKGKAENGSYSNAISFKSCQFIGATSICIRNPGEGWDFFSPTVEPLANGKAGFLVQEGGFTAKEVAIFGGWFGDANTEGDWIQYSGVGLTTVGCKVGAGRSWINAGEIAAVEGLVVTGCTFDTVANFLIVRAQAHTNWQVVANQYIGTGFISWAAGNMPNHAVIENPGDHVYTLGMMTPIAGAVSDASFPITPPDMTLAYDTTNNKLYVRNGGAWKSVQFV